MPQNKILSLDNLSLQEINTDAELIPLLTPEDEEEMNNELLPADLPIFAFAKHGVVSRCCYSNNRWKR